jgi:hypothetical protein
VGHSVLSGRGSVSSLTEASCWSVAQQTPSATTCSPWAGQWGTVVEKSLPLGQGSKNRQKYHPFIPTSRHTGDHIGGRRSAGSLEKCPRTAWQGFLAFRGGGILANGSLVTGSPGLSSMGERNLEAYVPAHCSWPQG